MIIFCQKNQNGVYQTLDPIANLQETPRREEGIEQHPKNATSNIQTVGNSRSNGPCLQPIVQKIFFLVKEKFVD